MKNDEIQISFYSLLKKSRESKEIDLQTISDEIKIFLEWNVCAEATQSIKNNI